MVEIERKEAAALVIIRIYLTLFVFARIWDLSSRHAGVLCRVIAGLVYRLPDQGTQETQN